VRSFAFRIAERREPAAPAHTGRPRGLGLVGAGFGRTGTMSLKIALERLGLGPCYHTTEVNKNPSHPRLWRAADAGDPVDWPALFARYRAAVDWPACSYYRELADVFPDAKVILTLRDPDEWYDSVASTLYRLKVATDNYMSASLSDAGTSRPAPLYENPIWAKTFAGRFTDRQHAIEVFKRHNAEVVNSISPGRLLVYQVSEGWPALCDFLGLAIPGDPFPHVNTTQSFREYNGARLRYA
jgi:hypothetical protein